MVLSISEFTGHLLFILAFDSNDLRFCSTEIKLIKSELSSIDIRKDQELSGASIRENQSGLYHRSTLSWTLEILSVSVLYTYKPRGRGYEAGMKPETCNLLILATMRQVGINTINNHQK